MRTGHGALAEEDERRGLQEESEMDMRRVSSNAAQLDSPPESPAEMSAEPGEGYIEELDDPVAPGHPSIFQVTWRIRNFSRVPNRVGEQINSRVFEIGGVAWSIMLYPQGVRDQGCMSVFLDSSPHTKRHSEYSHTVYFELELISSDSTIANEKKIVCHCFTPDDGDWGFHNFVKLSTLHNPANSYLTDDVLTVNYPHAQYWPYKIIDPPQRVTSKAGLVLCGDTRGPTQIQLLMRVQSAEESRERHRNDPELMLHDPKTDTGFVGLKNQGATCYMNSLLQALFHVPALQRAVFQMPTEHEVRKRRKVEGQHPSVVSRPDTEVPQEADSVALALQRVFFQLRTSHSSVGTKSLTRSFGWDALDSFTQHDVQELDRVLCDNLEEKMKGTEIEGAVPRLFKGKLNNFVKCIGVDFCSEREEEFYDLSLNVKGCKSLMESLKSYIEVERLDGDNKYMAEGHGLVDAQKGCSFRSFPPVLHLHLKRFEYDPMRDANVKINSSFEFHEEIDLAPYLEQGTDGMQQPMRYLLHSVLVHQGDVHGGHYYAFVRPDCKGSWFKFNDERVSKATKIDAVDDNYGNCDQDDSPASRKEGFSRVSNAYMLVYVRESEIADVLRPMTEADIPSHLVDRFTEEERESEKRKLEKRDQHKIAHLTVATAKDLLANHGAELCEWEKVLKITTRRDGSFDGLKKTLEETTHIPAARQRFWACIARKNRTTRPDSLVGDQSKYQEYMQQKNFEPVFKVQCFLEELPEGADADYLMPKGNNDAEPGNKPALIFFKLYNCKEGTLEYIGHTIAFKHETLGEVVGRGRDQLLPHLKEEQLLVYEEVVPETIAEREEDLTLEKLEIQVGDIIVLQWSGERGKSEVSTKPTHMGVKGYYDFLLHKISVRCRDISEPDKDAFMLELHLKANYDEILNAIADKLNQNGEKQHQDPFLIQLWQSKLQEPGEAPWEYPWQRAKKSCLEILHQRENKEILLYFERITFDIRELEDEDKCLVGLRLPPYKPREICWAVVDKRTWIQGCIDAACEAMPMLPKSRLALVKVSKTGRQVCSITEPDADAPKPKFEMMRYHVVVAHKGTDTDGCEDVKMDDDPNSFGNLRDFRIVAENAILVQHFEMERGQRMQHVPRFWGVPMLFLPIKDETVGEFKSRVRLQAWKDVLAAEVTKSETSNGEEDGPPTWKIVVVGTNGILESGQHSLEDDAAPLDLQKLIGLDQNLDGTNFAIEHPDKNRHAYANRSFEKAIRIAR